MQWLPYGIYSFLNEYQRKHGQDPKSTVTHKTFKTSKL